MSGERKIPIREVFTSINSAVIVNAKVTNADSEYPPNRVRPKNPLKMITITVKKISRFNPGGSFRES